MSDEHRDKFHRRKHKEKETDKHDTWSSEEEDVDEEVHPLAHYADSRAQLLRVSLGVLGGRKVMAMLPPPLRNISPARVKAICLQELETLSKHTLLAVLQGTSTEKVAEMPSSQPADSTSAELEVVSKKQLHRKRTPTKQHHCVSASTNKNSWDDDEAVESGQAWESDADLDTLEIGIDQSEMGEILQDTSTGNKGKSSKPRKKALKKRPPKVMEKHSKTGKNAANSLENRRLNTQPTSSLNPKEVEEENDNPVTVAAEENEVAGKTLMELLELEMRARAIKALLKRHDTSESGESNGERNSCNLENVPLQENEEDANDQKECKKYRLVKKEKTQQDKKVVTNNNKVMPGMTGTTSKTRTKIMKKIKKEKVKLKRHYREREICESDEDSDNQVKQGASEDKEEGETNLDKIKRQELVPTSSRSRSESVSPQSRPSYRDYVATRPAVVKPCVVYKRSLEGEVHFSDEDSPVETCKKKKSDKTLDSQLKTKQSEGEVISKETSGEVQIPPAVTEMDGKNCSPEEHIEVVEKMDKSNTPDVIQKEEPVTDIKTECPVETIQNIETPEDQMQKDKIKVMANVAEDMHILELAKDACPSDEKVEALQELGNKDKENGNESNTTWYQRWYQSHKVQRVVSASKMYGKVRSKLKSLRKVDKTTDGASEGMGEVDAADSPKMIGSIEEYERIVGKKVIATEQEAVSKDPEPELVVVEEQDSDDELWGKIMGN